MCRFFKIFRTSLIIIVSNILLFTSCNKKVEINFKDELISMDTHAIIEINIPKASGNSKIAKKINDTLEQFVVLALDNNAVLAEKTMRQAVKAFDNEFKEFNQQIPEQLTEELPVWEALIDGEITYQSDDFVSIGMNANINTGAVKNRSYFEFYNFDLETGKKLKTSDIVEDEEAFKLIVKRYFDKELLTNFKDASAVKQITEKNFSLPKTIGFSDDGIIILFDNFGGLFTETIEFTVPFDQAEEYLKY